MDYDKLAREILYDEFIPTELHTHLVAKIAQALERAVIQASIAELYEVRTQLVRRWEWLEARIAALRKRLEELGK